ncbi:hypothetical protein Ahy_B07g087644 [Arachis hypogaea]|uniref:Uncharacterized protein n=1 Tax=Arachis hypogaea TaxID=3818 RepID=A0A444YCM2_ARAHY|nr:hypothetical protein Ahy_B07g087644 [Arachis hypogaea]
MLPNPQHRSRVWFTGRQGRAHSIRLLEKPIVYFKLKVYHGGWFTYRNGPLEYVGGETTVIEEIDGDPWSVFEVYAELKQFGYVEENIPLLWFKDPTHEDLEKYLKLFKSDADSIAMCKITEVRDYVELMDDVGQQLVVYGGEDAGLKKSDAAADISGAENTEGGDDVNLDTNMSNYSDSDSFDSEYEPSEEEEETEDDLHFTSSEDELDPAVSGFQDVNVLNEKSRAVKNKRVATENFEDEDGAESDEIENDHKVGGAVSDSDHQGQSYPVHKHQKDMSQYKWEVGTVYATREEFKDTVTAYAVQRARAITFRKCDLQRVRAVCTGECPFWLYAAKMKEEDTWQLRSMNLTHTCTQTYRVEILHSRWLGKAFKKKVESNPKVKIRELVSKAQKKWNLTVTKSMATRTKQIALDEIQGTFQEQYKRIYDYAHELMRANPGTSVRLQRCSICGVVGHNKSRCPKPIENEAQNSKKQSKGKQSRGSNNSIPPAAKGGKKIASTQPTPKLTVKRKVASATQPTSSAQSNTVAPLKRPKGRPKGTMKPTPSAQPDPPTSSSQPTTTVLPASQPSFATTSSQPTRHYSVSSAGGPHVSPRKLKLMAKLPPKKWGLL